MNWLFIMPVDTQPRYHKRINAVSREGVDTHAMSFKRDYVPGSNDVKADILGEIEPGSYIKRLLPILGAVPKVRSEAGHSDVLYAFGLDMLLLSWLSIMGLNNRPLLVYEVADIRDILLCKSIVGKIVRSIERFLLGKSTILVVTSEAYLQGYFKRYHNVDNVKSIVIENKIDDKKISSFSTDVNTEISAKRYIKVGYFGLIRCVKSVRALAMAAESSISIHVKIKGVPHGNVKELSKLSDYRCGIAYEGPYVYPDDIREMYSTVDIVWACYPYSQHDTGNWKWARTNRFYESLFFGRPLIVQSGTEDAKYVERYGIGLVVDLGDVESASQQIASISWEDIKRWTQNLNQVPRSVYIYTDEHRRLVQVAKE